MSTSQAGPDAVCRCFEDAAIEAGIAIMAVFASDAGYREKADRSPVTEADERAEDIVCRHLSEAFPEIPIVAEEAVSAGRVPPLLGKRFFLVDPLDGTKEFVARRTDFTVNIALIEDGLPTHGVVFAPARGELFLGQPGIAWSCSRRAGKVLAPKRIHVREPAAVPVAVASRSHRTPETDAFVSEHGIGECISIGSSLKFCLIAEGKADIYPRFGRTMEWDTAAGDAVLRAAGGFTRGVDGGAFVYGKRAQPDDEDFANPPFVASSR